MPEKSAAEKILAAIRAVRRGQVAGYGEIARRAGLPGRARMVARLLSENDDPKLPWHRIVRSDGRIAFPPEHSNFVEQQQRLRAEGVLVRNGRVQGQKSTACLDELIWAEPRG
ncbi:MAG: MGMT family protein [Arenimonas sp.]